MDDGTFFYNKDNHYTGPVQVLGWSATNGSAKNGKAVALAYVDYLAHHPATAHRISFKLCQRFVSDAPPAALVDAMAAAYLAHDTAIVPVLRLMFGSDAFRQAKGEKVIRPMQDVVATLRILGIKAGANDGDDGLSGLVLARREHERRAVVVGAAQRVPGLRRTRGARRAARSTGGTRTSRWLPVGTTTSRRRTSARQLLPDALPKDHGTLVQTLAKRLVFRTLATPHRDALLGFLNRAAADPISPSSEAVGWRLPYLVALILDSPYHGIR